jgi:hypothetical protein
MLTKTAIALALILGTTSGALAVAKQHSVAPASRVTRSVALAEKRSAPASERKARPAITRAEPVFVSRPPAQHVALIVGVGY